MFKQAALVLLALAAVASWLPHRILPWPWRRSWSRPRTSAGTILASPDHVTVVSGEELVGAVSAADVLERAAGVSVPTMAR